MDLWQWHCRNRRGKKLLQLICGNAISEIGEKNLWQLWQCHCQKWEEKK